MDYGSLLINYIYLVGNALSTWISSWQGWWVATLTSYRAKGILLSSSTGATHLVLAGATT